MVIFTYLPLSSGACRKIILGTLSIMDLIWAAYSIQLFINLVLRMLLYENSKISLTTILLLLSFFFATYNYSLTRGRMGGWRVPWTSQRSKNRFKASLLLQFCKSFARDIHINRVFQTIQMKLMLLWVWAEQAILGRAKTALKFKYEI